MTIQRCYALTDGMKKRVLLQRCDDGELFLEEAIMDENDNILLKIETFGEDKSDVTFRKPSGERIGQVYYNISGPLERWESPPTLIVDRYDKQGNHLGWDVYEKGNVLQVKFRRELRNGEYAIIIYSPSGGRIDVSGYRSSLNREQLKYLDYIYYTQDVKLFGVNGYELHGFLSESVPHQYASIEFVERVFGKEKVEEYKQMIKFLDENKDILKKYMYPKEKDKD